MSSANAMPEPQLRRRYNWSFPVFLISIGLIFFYGADDLFGAVQLREFRSTEGLLTLGAVYLGLFFWIVRLSARAYAILVGVIILTIPLGGLLFLMFGIIFIFGSLMPVALVLVVMVLLGVGLLFAYRNQPYRARLKAQRIATATLCLFMAFYMIILGIGYENRTVFVTALPVADRTYHLYFIPALFGEDALELHECNQHSFACHRVYVEDLAYDQAAPFSLTIDAGSIVILANGDPVYRRPGPNLSSPSLCPLCLCGSSLFYCRSLVRRARHGRSHPAE